MITFGFNPLHCGAVVASRTRRRARREARHVSIPFIAGQWSLPIGFDNEYITSSKFQSPSLRGSGRFEIAPRRMAEGQGGFQSPSLRGSGRFARRGAGGSYSPSFRGSGRLSRPKWARKMGYNLSQSTSLRGSGRFKLLAPPDPFAFVQSQSPSLRGSGRFSNTATSAP